MPKVFLFPTDIIFRAIPVALSRFDLFLLFAFFLFYRTDSSLTVQVEFCLALNSYSVRVIQSPVYNFGSFWFPF